jgi:putative transposase
MPRVARVVIADVAHHVTQRGNGRQFILATDAERLDPGHLWTALRYVELNPVRAGMVGEAAAWPWSSAAAHCGTANPDACLDLSTWRKNWSAASGRKFLAAGETEAEVRSIRRCTHNGRPLGPAEFTRALEGPWKNAPSAAWRPARATVHAKLQRRQSPSVPKPRP